MLSARYLIPAVSLIGVAALVGCSRHTKSPAVSSAAPVYNESASTRPAVAGETDQTMAARESGENLRIEGQPVSPDPLAVEDRDARAGEQADETGANPDRIPDIDIKNLSRDGDIWVGGEPMDKGYQQIHDRGVTAVVDLRNSTPVQKQSAEEARRLGMDYVNLPIDPKKMDSEKASAFLDFMRQHQGQQVLIHCGSANRASGMYAVYLGAIRGMSTDQAIQRAKKTGLKEPELERDVRRFLDNHKTARPEE